MDKQYNFLDNFNKVNTHINNIKDGDILLLSNIPVKIDGLRFNRGPIMFLHIIGYNILTRSRHDNIFYKNDIVTKLVPKTIECQKRIKLLNRKI